MWALNTEVNPVDCHFCAGTMYLCRSDSRLAKNRPAYAWQGEWYDYVIESDQRDRQLSSIFGRTIEVLIKSHPLFIILFFLFSGGVMDTQMLRC